MPDAVAQLKNYRQSPRKVGAVARAIRGKRVALALAELQVMPKRAAGPLIKLILSGVASARAKGLSQNDLVISKLEVGKGMVFKRSTPRARGSMSLIRKKTSHVKIELSKIQNTKSEGVKARPTP